MFCCRVQNMEERRPADRPAKNPQQTGQVRSSILKTVARVGLSRRDPLETKPAAGRDGMRGKTQLQSLTTCHFLIVF